jgi:BON domain
MQNLSGRLGRSHSMLLASILGSVAASAISQTRTNPFNDPFVQVSAAIPSCPRPEPPGYTEQEIKDLAHERSQRGVSCWLDGRCRLHNSYLYDAEIVPRVQQAIRYDGRFANTSVWVLSQRRHVWLKGCVRTAEQAEQLEQLAVRVDDVERVLNQLMVGTGGTPPYAAAPAAR